MGERSGAAERALILFVVPEIAQRTAEAKPGPCVVGDGEFLRVGRAGLDGGVNEGGRES
jgi:hypothetical protein